MSEAVSLQGQTVVARSRYVHLRSLLGVAVVAIVGLTIAVVLLASNQGSTTTVVVPAAGGLGTSQSSSAQIGATLNHRGLDTSQASAAQVGARLDHRGLQQ
jgi:hypothetical protein